MKGIFSRPIEFVSMVNVNVNHVVNNKSMQAQKTLYIFHNLFTSILAAYEPLRILVTVLIIQPLPVGSIYGDA